MKSRETPAVVTVGRFSAGEQRPHIPSTAVLEGTIRSFDRNLSETLLRRIGEVAQGIASAFRGSAETCEIVSAPPLHNDDAMLDLSTACAQELFGDASVYRLREGGMARRTSRPTPTSCPAPICFSAPERHRRTRATASRCIIRRSCSTRIFSRAVPPCTL